MPDLFFVVRPQNLSYEVEETDFETTIMVENNWVSDDGTEIVSDDGTNLVFASEQTLKPRALFYSVAQHNLSFVVE